MLDTTRLGQKIRTTTEELSKLTAEHEQLNTYYNNLLNNSGKLSSDLAEQQKSLLELKDKVSV